MSSRLSLWVGLVVLLFGFCVPDGAVGARVEEAVDVNDLVLEVDALQALHDLRLTEAQLRVLEGWAKETMQKPGKREPGKASKEYRAKLAALRAALIKADDDDQIEDLIEELDELRRTEKPRTDTGIELTAAARKRAPEALRLLKVQQTKDYLDLLEDRLGDPLDRLLNAFESVRGLKGEKWRQRRDDLVDDLVRLANGADSDKADRLTDQLTELLSRSHALNDADFKLKRKELETDARKLLGHLGPPDVMRNVLEQSLAQLLANPKLGVALGVRLGKGK